MDITRGFILLSRSIDECNIFQNEKWLKVYIWCLIQANHKGKSVPIKTGKYQTVVNIERGQFIFGRNKAAEKLNMKPSTVRNIIQKLEKLGNLDIQKDSHYSIVTILDYEFYQNPESYKGQATGQAEDNQRTGKGQPKDTTNTPKQPKNDKHSLPPNPEDFEITESFKKWAEKKGISFEQLESYIETCLIWHSSKGNKYARWDRTIQNWINKDLRDNPQVQDNDLDFL